MKYKLIVDKNQEEQIIAIVHAPSSLTEEIENLVFSFSGNEHIIGYKDDEIKKLSFCNIECITVQQRKTIAVYSDGSEYRLRGSLRDFESILPAYFIRINKSCIANEHCIKEFVASFNGGVNAVFKCGYKDYVSRRCFTHIRRRYENIWKNI